MTGYKAMNKDMTCRDFKYEVGKTYEIEGKLEICKNGFHFCKNIVDTAGYYEFDKDVTTICEVEALGEIAREGTKLCTNKIKIIKEVPWDEIDELIDDDYNSGHYNTGHYNSGDYNSGNRNSGNRNSGNHNSGKYNSGNRNSGNRNTGYYNSGHYNSGDYNSGYYNSGNRNSGFFNSITPTVRLFNKDSGMTFDEIFNLEINWYNLEDSKDIIKNLPNYDAQIFYECTGIDWRNE